MSISWARENGMEPGPRARATLAFLSPGPHSQVGLPEVPCALSLKLKRRCWITLGPNNK